MNRTNFLIGRGEMLTSEIKAPKRKMEKKEIYTLEENIMRLAPQISYVSSELDKLPSKACPRDYGVVTITINPSFIAKSYFPDSLLRLADLRSVGSRTIKITPERWAKKKEPQECTTTELFVAGKRESFREIKDLFGTIQDHSYEALDLAHIERVSSLDVKDQIKSYGEGKERFFEVGIHLLQDEPPSFIQNGFESYATTLGFKIYNDLSFQVGNIWFIPVEGSHEGLESLVKFSFVRMARPVPKIRGLRPIKRASTVCLDCALPKEQPLSSQPKVAILDGGLPKDHPIKQWLKSYIIVDPDAQDDEEVLDHGLAVTSAFLFGPIETGGTAERPYSYANHLRVLDSKSYEEDPLELYRTLGLIEQVLLSRQYEFINLSLGPDIPIEDTDVHAWTSVIDDLLSDGETFMTIAIGNNGNNDRLSGNARVQVPGDCVNSVSVGATDTVGSAWSRASYSAFGPGRSPGVVKPDLMAFGGSPKNYFHVLSPGKDAQLVPTLGTSFAAPYLLRSAVGIRAILGDDLSMLAIKALLIHSADTSSYDKFEVGWGKVPEDLMNIITCGPGVARVVYQGELKPGKYLRAQLPIPKGGLSGRIRIKATFCYASPVDPQDAATYTRAGLEVHFRPDVALVKPNKSTADTKGFFDMKKYATEFERRSDMGKWETVLHANKGMLGRTLKNPVFDIHYNARQAGAPTLRADKIRYALVITVEAPKHADLFNDILNTYPSILVQIQPQISLPITV